MLLCALPLALLALVAGTLLLTHTKKENLGNFHKFVSWFVIVLAFLSVLGVFARGAMRCCPMHHEMEVREYGMDRGDMMMERMRGHGMMGHREMMGGGCCNGMMGGSCQEGMNECHEGMGECQEGKDGGTCPMMKGDMHERMEMKDSVKKK